MRHTEKEGLAIFIYQVNASLKLVSVQQSYWLATLTKRPTDMLSMKETATCMSSTVGILLEPRPSSCHLGKLNAATYRQKNDKLPSGKILNHPASQCKRMI